MLLHLLGTPTPAPPADLWGSAIPTWIGSLGGVIAAVVGAWALINSLRAKGGVQQIAHGLNESEASAVVPVASTHASSIERAEPTAWSVRPSGGKGNFRLANTSPNRATLLSLEANAGLFRMHVPLPVDVEPNNGVPFSLIRAWGAPAVISIQARWRETDGYEGSATYYV